jgi:hypothetical protein
MNKKEEAALEQIIEETITRVDQESANFIRAKIRGIITEACRRCWMLGYKSTWHQREEDEEETIS